MVFRKLMHAFGAGGPSVDTVLERGDCQPGGLLRGEVRLRGGDRTVTIERIELGLVTRVEFEGGEHEQAGGVEFARLPLSGGFELPANTDRSIPFQFAVPWEAPVTAVFGQALRGMAVGLRTEVAVAKAIDAGDLDPVAIHPLPAQELFLDAVARLGFTFRSADVEYGQLRGVPQQLPFYQEIEFFPAPQYAGRLNELELTFVAGPHAVDVVLEVDKRGGLFSGGADTFHHLRIDYATAGNTDWAGYLDGWLQQLLTSAHGAFSGHGALGGPAAFGAHGSHGYGHHGHRRHRGGLGMGAVAGGAAAGFVGGMVAGEMLDEAGDAVFGDDEEGDFF
ncbi:sporulation protein [Cryptosporangium minutisporangium]|uniref:Sporulation protein n=1 Tax=Cryptosporangium minutisporangium TaxID=113569 RepID=A0ABP6SYP9_9ACTN